MSKTIVVKVIPQAKKASIREEAGMLKVYVVSPAIGGCANKDLMVSLSKYFGVRKSSLTIIKGLKSRIKTISIDGIYS